jgi:hypothetical protein
VISPRAERRQPEQRARRGADNVPRQGVRGVNDLANRYTGPSRAESRDQRDQYGRPSTPARRASRR